MVRIDAGRSGRYCDGMSRRSFVQLGIAGMASVGLPQLLRAKTASRESGTPGKDVSVILIWLDGGPGHMDTYDMKPDAPVEYRGIWNPIRTNVPGTHITELFPRQAKIADKFSLIRSLHHDSGDHFTGGHYMLTSRGGASGADTTGKSPSIGSIVTKVLGPRKPGMPAYIGVPYAASIGLRPGYFGANYLGHSYAPFETNGDPNSANFQVDNIQLASTMSIERLQDRRSLLAHFDRMRRDMDASGAMETMDSFDHKAYEMVTGGAARQAFDISAEEPRTRDMYGRHTWGQSTLLARRLVEAGATWVTVHLGGWDHHWDLKKGYENYLPIVDTLTSAQFIDLEQRGLLDQTLVILCGEFSRTPRMNDGGNGGPPGSMGTPGRDHWGNAMSVLIGGGGVQGGRIVGATNRLGEVPTDRPLEPCDLHATIYHLLGINPQISFLNLAGRPVPAIDRGEVISELL
jgi:hypothetical protein